MNVLRLVLVLCTLSFLGCSEKKVASHPGLDGKWYLDAERTHQAIANAVGHEVDELPHVQKLYRSGDFIEIDQKTQTIRLQDVRGMTSQYLHVLDVGSAWAVAETGIKDLSHKVLFRFEGKESDVLWMEIGVVERRCYRRREVDGGD